MPNKPVYDSDTNKKAFSQIYGTVFFILIIALTSIIFILIRTDVVTNSVLKKENIPFLLIISDENGPVLTEAILFNARTKRLALIDVPAEAGDLLAQLKRSGRYSVFYRQGQQEIYQRSIEELLRVKFLFVLDLHITELVKLVDLLEGISLYLFAPEDRIDPISRQRYIYHAGEQLLDGNQSRDFLYASTRTVPYEDYRSMKHEESGLPNIVDSAQTQDNATTGLTNSTTRDHTAENRKTSILRQQNLRFSQELLLAMVATLQQYHFEREQYIDLLYSYFQTALSKRSFRKLLLYLSEIELNSAEVILQDYLGKERMVQDEVINFPIYNGEVIRSQVVRISTQLQNQEEIVEEQYPVRVEVLNGTYISGLASRTAAIYSRQGFDVTKVDNAKRSDYEQTVVINLHSNNLDDVRRVAEVIGAQNMVLRPLSGGERAEAEVRVVLGRDFNGSQVER